MKVSSTHLLMCLMIMVGLSACAPTYQWRGNYPSPDVVAKIHVGRSTKKDVIALWGAPTYTQHYDGTGWYYVGEETQTMSFYRPEVMKRQVILVTFGPKDVVASLDIRDQLPSSTIEMISDQTPTLGRDPAFFKEFFGAIGKHDEGKSRAGYVRA